MPKLWSETIQAHRREVRDAILHSAAELVAEHGLHSVTMSQIAEETGIGRATLYKYFPDVESILVAWQDRQITAHLRQLTEARDRAANPRERLEAVLTAYASIQHGSHSVHSTELAAHMHRDEHVAHAHEVMRDLMRGLVAAAAEAGDVRADVPPDELADYCLHALAAARSVPSNAAVGRLVQVILTGLRERAPRTRVRR